MNIAQVAGSGTAATCSVSETSSSSEKGGWPSGVPLARKARYWVAPVAVKVLDRLAVTDPAIHAVLRRELYAEAAALAAIDDPHCVKVYDVVDQQGAAALVTEYVEGASLRAVLARHGHLEPRQALGVLRGAFQGLVAVHRAGVVHGDLKPDNVLLDRRGISH
ncbi:protein kinase domain-containing protein, partial [Raoultella terrigena]|uniref:protein kinase domain-containing protein n=1 Tax=Raoultella terrigena TaxID=577 RepID=UPI002167284D